MIISEDFQTQQTGKMLIAYVVIGLLAFAAWKAFR